MPESLTIGKIARSANVGVETVRFYEREGLIDEPPRKQSGYRQYPVETISRIRFIKRAKELGFTLKETGELLRLQVDSEATCGDVRSRAETKIREIQDKIRTLRKMEAALEELKKACDGLSPVVECPILKALEYDS